MHCLTHVNKNTQDIGKSYEFRNQLLLLRPQVYNRYDIRKILGEAMNFETSCYYYDLKFTIGMTYAKYWEKL